MKFNTCLVVDVWEGQPTMDFAALRAGGVAGIGIRLNDMSGGHHMDQAFTQLWAGAADFVRFPYFVYNPWVDGAANFAWLVAHLPAECKSVALDVEVRYSGYAANVYAGEISKFMQLAKINGLKIIIYTGQGYTSLLSKWPVADFWWAQYPSPANYFAGVKTWDELRVRLDRLDKPFNVGLIPAGGTLKLWQFSGDYLLLPGSNRDMDVNIFYGSEQELADYFGTAPSADNPPPVDETPVTKSGLYRFAGYNYWARPGGGPLTLPMTHSKGKLGDNLSRYPWSTLAPILRGLNPTNPAALDLIARPDWGPSKGLEGNYIKWIGLLWPGRNIVQIDEIVDGWGLVSGCPLSEAEKLNPYDNPNLVHLVYDYNKSTGWGERLKPVYVPILGGPWWVEMNKLVSVDSQLPKSVRVIAIPWLNVRQLPKVQSPIVSRRLVGTTVTILEVTIAHGGIWGRIDLGWIALRYNDRNFTDWKI